MKTYAANDRDRFEPPACPRCGARPTVKWTDVSTYGNPNQWMPAHGVCWTPGCLNERGNNLVFFDTDDDA